MRLRRLKVTRAAMSGGLLDGADIRLGRTAKVSSNEHMEPLCLVGPNGSGKSQFLQLLAEIFQAAWNAHAPDQERTPANSDALFELEYSIRPAAGIDPATVKLSRATRGKSVGPIELRVWTNGSWRSIEPGTEEFGRLLPPLIVGYTSGDNETMSLPFLVSRSGYADSVARSALSRGPSIAPADNRLLLIDYGTNLEVLFANLLLGGQDARKAILEHARVRDIASCRCVVRLAHSAAPKAPAAAKKVGGRKGIQLTGELEIILDRLKRSATCWAEDPKTETYIFDYFIDAAARTAFSHFFENAFDLYRAIHKFALLNDLVLPKASRTRLDRAVRERRFASRLPEPQQEEMVFGFEEVRFHPAGADKHQEPVDYVALSDGEHQQALILGIFSMITDHNVLFILDEPESHFNPQWRVQFVKRLLDLPGVRGDQEVILTSHAPFVPADISREQVLIFARNKTTIEVNQPEIETYGANFDRILEHCFEVRPPISQMARDEIRELLTSDDIGALTAAMDRLGSSVEKSFLADHLRQLKLKVGG